VDYIESIEKALDYIEFCLTEDITLEAIARESCFSPFHFHRLFHGMVGLSVMDYVRKRRLANAAVELIRTHQRIGDIAMEYNFCSLEHFSRVFKKNYGVTPGEYRFHNIDLNLFPKADLLQRTFPEVISLEPRFVHRESFLIGGLVTQGNIENIVLRAMSLWKVFNSKLGEITNPIQLQFAYGIALDNGSGFWSYMAGVEIENLENLPSDFVGKKIPASKYAVFPYQGPIVRIQEAYDAIYGRWLPSTDYQLGDYEFEYYNCNVDKDDSDNSRFDIYIAVK
jgi:AraC family transcriptional regulator